MSRRGVHAVIGQLVTDGAFRRRVERGGSAYLAGLRGQGIDLNRLEIAALIEVDPRVWKSAARQIALPSGTRQGAPDAGPPGVEGTLTDQQQRVLAGVCEGLRNRDIAAQLGVSESAVKATVRQLFHKFSVRRRVHLVRLALDWPSRAATGPPAVRHARSDRHAHVASGASVVHAT